MYFLQLLRRRKTVLEQGESLANVTEKHMSDEEPEDRGGMKVFVRRTPRSRSYHLTQLLRRLDGRLEAMEKAKGQSTTPRVVGPIAEREVPQLPAEFRALVGLI